MQSFRTRMWLWASSARSRLRKGSAAIEIGGARGARRALPPPSSPPDALPPVSGTSGKAPTSMPRQRSRKC